MPKNCSAPNCKFDAGNANDRKSFYRFPLHDPVRLQQWLKNMGREGWAPSKHHYICHKHFTPSCFKLRWGIRYLDTNAVPTVFNGSEKRKGLSLTEKTSKRLCYHTDWRSPVPDSKTPTHENMDTGSDFSTVQLYEITVDPSQSGEALLVETDDVPKSVDFFHVSSPTPVIEDSGLSEVDFPVTLFQTVEDLQDFEGDANTEVVLVTECPSTERQEEPMSTLTTAILNHCQGLLVRDSTHGSTEDNQASLVDPDLLSHFEDPSEGQDNQEREVIAYFEMIPNMIASRASAHLAFSPDTVLSSALDSKPILSTLPIVSKHTPTPPSPASLVLTMERLEPDGGEADRQSSEEDNVEQLEEHCYHRNSLSKEQLEAIVAELQKKVKVLQQRHRRHLEKLVGLENTVSQLRQSNLVTEERLQLLERACIQTSATVPDAGETVAIIYEEDNGAYFYAPIK